MEKTKSGKGGCLVVVILCVLWLPALILYVRHSTAVEHRYSRNLLDNHMHRSEYAEALDIDELTYKAVIARYGYPTQIHVAPKNESCPRSFTAGYPGFSMTYVTGYILDNEETKAVPKLVQVTTADETYRFGKRQIGVGSTREDIAAAYAGDLAIEADRLSHGAYYFPNPDAGYYGDYWDWILFRYDENGRVSEMAYMLSGYW